MPVTDGCTQTRRGKLETQWCFLGFARIKIYIAFKFCLSVVYDALLLGPIWLALHELKF